MAFTGHRIVGNCIYLCCYANVLHDCIPMSPLLGSKKGCAHDSEDDDTDDSDLEEGEIRSDSDSDDDDTLKVPPEVQAKLDHPERLHRDICFNDKGEVSALLADLMLARHIALSLSLTHSRYEKMTQKKKKLVE